MDGPTSRRAFLSGVALGVTSGAAGCLSRSTAVGVAPTGDGLRSAADRADTQFRGGPQRRGVFPEAAIPRTPAVEWVVPRINTGEHTAAKASPVPTPAGDLVVPGDTGDLRRLTTDGDLVWQVSVEPASRGIHGTPAIANGTVYIGAYDGAFYAFDLETGERVWRRRLGHAIGSSPAYHDGTLYIAVEYIGPDGAIFALDPVTGRTDWVDRRPIDHPHSSCAIDPSAGRLVVGANDGTLYGWTYPGLDFRWSFPTGRPIKGPIATANGSAFFGSWDRTAYRVDLETGQQEWAVDMDGLVMTGPSVEPATDTVYVGSHDNRLYALELETGEVRWRFGTDGSLIGCPTVTRDHVLVGSYDGRCYAVRKDSGEERWSVAANGRVTSTPLVVDGAVYFTDRASRNYLRTGEGPTGSLYKVGSAGRS